METASEPINYLQQMVEPTRQKLLNNGLYYRLHTLPDLRRFMEHHVFAVWDFMSLLKGLQRELTCVQLPWLPTDNPTTRRLINEIVLEEETDHAPNGQVVSHFELYVQAMEACGADTVPIQRLVAAVAEGYTVAQALDKAQAPDSVRQFVETTFDIINSGKPHMIAAAFTFGREDLIPAMFRQLVGDLRERFPGQLDLFTYYLDRHIELDEEVHAPLAQQMVRELCGESPERWLEAQQVTIQCLESRMALWDGIKPTKPSPALA
jgi:pyrroloquinoline quinone (PQQ) biosynthesis protein C